MQFVDFRGDFEGGFIDLFEAVKVHAEPRPRHKYEADQLIGACVRARLNGEVELSDKLLNQASYIDKSISELKNKFWQKLANPVMHSLQKKFSPLYLVENTEELKETIYKKHKTYQWSLCLEGDDDVLEIIDHVAYHLHPTFTLESQIVRSRNNGFRLKQVGWGRFTVKLEIKLKSRHTVEFKYPLTFKESNKELIKMPDLRFLPEPEEEFILYVW